MSARKKIVIVLVILAALFINFAPYLGAIQAEHIVRCDEESPFYIEREPCAFYEYPLRHLPEAIFETPTDTFERWYKFGEDMIDWFGMPGDLPNDILRAVQVWRFWIGMYTSCVVFAVVIVIRAYFMASAPRPVTVKISVDGGDVPPDSSV